MPAFKTRLEELNDHLERLAKNWEKLPDLYICFGNRDSLIYQMLSLVAGIWEHSNKSLKKRSFKIRWYDIDVIKRYM